MTTAFGGNVVAQVPLVTPAVITQLMPDGALVTTPLPVPAPLIATPCVLKIASAVRPCDIASWHGSMVQSPAQPLKTAFPFGDWVSVTMLLATKYDVQVPLVVVPLITQLIPAGTLVITPLPAEPDPGATVTRCGAAVKAADTAVVTPLVMGSTQVPPLQAPLKPSKLPPFDPPLSSVTLVPASKGALHTPLVTPAVTVHAIPEGELVTVPAPVPVPVTLTVPRAGRR